jgi:Rieske Fe-S protein
MSNRRTFLKQACGATCGLIASVLLGDLVKAAPVPGKKPYKAEMDEQNRVNIPLEALEEEVLTIRVKDLEYDVLLYRKTVEAGVEYKAVYLRCTHFDNGLKVTPGGLVCSMHGSRFDFEGNVTESPAQRPLLQFPVTANTETNFITIQIQNHEQ